MVIDNDQQQLSTTTADNRIPENLLNVDAEGSGVEREQKIIIAAQEDDNSTSFDQTTTVTTAMVLDGESTTSDLIITPIESNENETTYDSAISSTTTVENQTTRDEFENVTAILPVDQSTTIGKYFN